MKKAIVILLSLTMILGLTACGNSASKTKQPSTEDTFVESKADTESAETSTNMENTDNQDVQNHKALVAYFSATGTTKGVAEHIANGLNADIYEIVFIGYPIWWGEAPRIVSTFVESYDFSGKTIVPFCTSGGSDIGSSATSLEQLTNGATWLDGRRLNGSDSQDTVMEWVNSLDLNLAE